jgi:FkbM family methyltransferase
MIKTVWGGLFIVPGNDLSLLPALLFDGTYDVPFTKMLGRQLRAGQTFIDVGANIGLFSVLAGLLLGPTGRVIAYEADPEIAVFLHRNIELNRLTDRVEIRQCAAAAEAGEVTFTAAEEFRAQGSLREEAVQGRQHKVTVRSEPLDSLDIHNAALIKIDVQGSEFLVFQGMRRLLEERRVDAISFELERDLLGDDFHALMTFLHELSASGARFSVPLANGRDRLISPELTELEQATKLSQVVIDFTVMSHPRFRPTKAIGLNSVAFAS